LEGLRSYSYDEFVSNPEHYGSAERFLQLSIEAVSDIGSHIIADMELGEISWHRDIPEIFARKNYINSALAEKWVRMIGFRNILVHDYLDIDRHAVFDVLQNKLTDFQELKVVFAQFL